VILDLEDAVATAEKVATRTAIAAALARPRSGVLYVRVNAADTEFCCGDLVEVVRPGLDGIILPKVESPATLTTIDWVLLLGLQGTGRLETGHVGQPDIHDDQVRLVLARQLQAVGGIGRLEHLMALRLEQRAEQGRIQMIVLDDQDALLFWLPKLGAEIRLGAC
jgi:citrate lyase subunit beta/citryl-CoA lyase